MMIAVFVLIGIGLLLSFLRMVKGPTTMDRIVSVDTMNIMITGLIAVLAVFMENNMFIDIAIVYGVLAFLETIILAKYVEGKS